MQTTYASVPARQDSANEDRFRSGKEWALVLDGAGRYPGRSGGCIHPVTWVVEHLADHACDQLTNPPNISLVGAVRNAIQATAEDHRSTCDLTDPLTPGAALAVVRVQDDHIEWLVLGDCAVAFERRSAEPLVIIDDRVDRLPGAPVNDAEVRTYDPDYVATVRNQPGGFWVAAATPEAAGHALSGQIHLSDINQVLVCSDGVTRLTERHGWTWPSMFEHASQYGPAALIEAVRQADAADPNPRRWRGKLHDDATAALIQFSPGEGSK